MIPSEGWVIPIAPLMVLAGVVLAIGALIAWESRSLWRVPLSIGLATVGGMAFAGVLREDDAGYPPRRKRRRSSRLVTTSLTPVGRIGGQPGGRTSAAASSRFGRP